MSEGVPVKTYATHTLFDQEMLWQKNSKTIPGNYTGFLQILNKHNLRRAKPIDTFAEFKENQFSVPDELKDPKTKEVDV